MTKAIIFDIGGVIIDLNYNRAIESFRTKAGFMDVETFLDPWKQRGFFADLESGKMSEEDFTRLCLSKCRPGTTPGVLEECLMDFLDGIRPEKAEIIRKLSEKYPLYLLSNNNPISMRCCERLFSESGITMEKYFPKRFISSEMKMVKPDAPIFLEAIRETGCLPGEILFIDDSTNNVKAALSLGMDARLCTGLESFCETFREFL